MAHELLSHGDSQGLCSHSPTHTGSTSGSQPVPGHTRVWGVTWAPFTLGPESSPLPNYGSLEAPPSAPTSFVVHPSRPAPPYLTPPTLLIPKGAGRKMDTAIPSKSWGSALSFPLLTCRGPWLELKLKEFKSDSEGDFSARKRDLEHLSQREKGRAPSRMEPPASLMGLL